MLAPFISLHPCQYTEAASGGEGYFPHGGERVEEILWRGGGRFHHLYFNRRRRGRGKWEGRRKGPLSRSFGTSTTATLCLPPPPPLLKCLSVEKKREARGEKDFDTDEAAGGGADFFLPLLSSSSPNVGRK